MVHRQLVQSDLTRQSSIKRSEQNLIYDAAKIISSWTNLIPISVSISSSRPTISKVTASGASKKKNNYWYWSNSFLRFYHSKNDICIISKTNHIDSIWFKEKYLDLLSGPVITKQCKKQSVLLIFFFTCIHVQYKIFNGWKDSLTKLLVSLSDLQQTILKKLQLQGRHTKYIFPNW